MRAESTGSGRDAIQIHNNRGIVTWSRRMVYTGKSRTWDWLSLRAAGKIIYWMSALRNLPKRRLQVLILTGPVASLCLWIQMPHRKSVTKQFGKAELLRRSFRESIKIRDPGHTMPLKNTHLKWTH